MFVVFWRDCPNPRDIESGFDQFQTLDTQEEAAAKFAALCLLPSTYCAGWAPIMGASEPQWIQPAPTPSVFDSLVAEFDSWLISQGLDGESDDAHGYAMRSDLTPAERAWLSDFIRRWDAMESERDAIRESMRANEQSDARRSALQRRLNELG